MSRCPRDLRITDDPERGSAPLMVSLFGLLAIAVVSSLAGAAVSEFRQIGDGLAQIRAYWAAQGQAQYVLSRVRQDGSCAAGKDCGATPDDAVKAYLGEVRDALAGGKKGGAATWIYPELGSGAQFSVSSSGGPDPTATAGKAGAYLLRFDVAASAATPEALRAMTVARPVEIRFCTVGAPGLPCGCATPAAPYGCSGAFDPTTPYQNVTSVHRPARPAAK